MIGREAKEFLVAQIVAEAKRQGAPLDDVERKMLYFTETAWMPEDTWEGNEIFERDYDRNAYEHRIADLVAKWKDDPNHDLRQWDEAVACLRSGDHYLLVLIHHHLFALIDPSLQQGAPQKGMPWRVKYIIVGIIIGALTIFALLAWHAFFGNLLQ